LKQSRSLFWLPFPPPLFPLLPPRWLGPNDIRCIRWLFMLLLRDMAPPREFMYERLCICWEFIVIVWFWFISCSQTHNSLFFFILRCLWPVMRGEKKSLG
jgi:hypothetical protein